VVNEARLEKAAREEAIPIVRRSKRLVIPRAFQPVEICAAIKAGREDRDIEICRRVRRQ
jgi:hypothetical protein